VRIAHRKLPFDPARDFAPVTMLASGPLLLVVHPSLPVRNVRELIALAVTSAARSRIAPELPTISEAGVPGYELSSWYGLLAPVGTPAAIVNRLQQEVAKVFKAADLAEKLLALGVEPLANVPHEFAKALAAEIAK
jgi:tripartite-type tricarboxylate transporter receptor subunit TctC